MKKLLELLCGLLSGTALFAIMALTFFDVLGRKFLSNSIPGSLEITELLMVIVIFGALPLVSERGEHVEFDSLDLTCRSGCASSRGSSCTCCARRCCWAWAG
jgi:TRAP-type transport system small permease protein